MYRMSMAACLRRRLPLFNNTNAHAMFRFSSRYETEAASSSISNFYLDKKEYLWEAGMMRFWEDLNFKAEHIDVLINLGHGKYNDPTLLSMIPGDVSVFTDHSLQQTRHLRKAETAQRYLQTVQKVFPNMSLNKAIYGNPFFLTLTLGTITKRKSDLIDVISNQLSQETNYPRHTNTDERIKHNNAEYLSKAEIIELLDWDRFFESVPEFLTKDFKEIIRQIHVLRKLLSVNYRNNMGLSQIEFIEFIEVYPKVFRMDYLEVMGKYRFFIEFASASILRKRKFLYQENVDFTMIGNEHKYESEISFTSYEDMLSDYRVVQGYKMVTQYLVSIGWIFNCSWMRLSRLRYWNYNPEMRKKYGIPEILRMKTPHFLTVADQCWRSHCLKTKHSFFHNQTLHENWRDDQVHSNPYEDYPEFIKSRLRSHFDTMVQWNENDVEETKLLLKKDKNKLRAPLKKSKGANEEDLEKHDLDLDDLDLEKPVDNKLLRPKMYTLLEKHQRSQLQKNMKKLEELNGRFSSTVYTPYHKDMKQFLRDGNDFGFNYDLKYSDVNVVKEIDGDDIELQ